MTKNHIIASVDANNRLLAVTVTFGGETIIFPVASIFVRQVEIRDLEHNGYEVIGPNIVVGGADLAVGAASRRVTRAQTRGQTDA